MQKINIEKINKIIEDVKEINEKYKKYENETDKYYNFFEICEIENSEVIICRVLHSLLNKNGRHGQKTKFLKLFFENVLQVNYNNIDYDSYIVEKEYHTDNNRRIDICIKNDKEIFPVEVKIFAGDQFEQIKDYFEFCKKNLKCEKIYYLTIDGHKPSEYSIKNINISNIKCCSFKDVVNWLEECEKSINKEDFKLIHTKEIIFQLKNNVKRLCNMNEKNKEIKDILYKDKENINAFLCMNEVINDIKLDLLKEVMLAVTEKLYDKKLITAEQKIEIRGKINSFAKISKRKNKPFVVFQTNNEKLDYTFGIENDDCFYIGLKFKDNKANEKEAMSIFEKLGYKKIDGKIDTSPTWPFYEYICLNEDEPISFINFDSGTICLMDKDIQNNFVEKTVNSIIYLKEKVETKL